MQISTDNPLGLRVPEQSPPTRSGMTQPKEFETWMEGLPMGNSALMAKQLLHALQNINCVAIPAQQRIRVADLFIQPVDYAISSLEHHFVDSGFPLSQKTYLQARLCIRLHEELAFAYKSAVLDLVMGKIEDKERAALVVALFQSIRHLAETVYRSSLIYDPAPRHAWHELHNLFAFAERNRWSVTRIRVPDQGEGEAMTLREQYVRILLFAAAEPSRMRPAQIRALFLELPHWAPKARITAATDLSQADTRFIVELIKDQPARHIGLLREPPQRPALELNTEPLIPMLRERSESVTEQNPAQPGPKYDEKLSGATLQQLIRNWGVAPKRRPERTRLHFDLKVAVGLLRIHGLISGEAPTGQNAPATFDLSGMDEPVTAPDSIADIDDGPHILSLDGLDAPRTGEFSSGMNQEQQDQHATPIWPRDQAQPPMTGSGSPTFSLNTINESAGGFCVNWQGQDIPGIKLGELLGIQAPGDPTAYGLAVARWMRNEPGDRLELGLQLMAQRIFAVKATLEDRDQGTPEPCLLLPELKRAHRPASLVLSTQPFKVGDNLQVRQEEREYRVRLVRLVESTGAFAQFQFQYT